MQVTGNQFTNTVALYGNDIATFPTIRGNPRPQVRFSVSGTAPLSSNEVHTPGDAIDVLIAMNPAALKVNVADLKANGILIVNSDGFTENDCARRK
jgi:2-oxoglutarate ferredoxin oxidoreductase subunit alpha